MVLHVGRRHVFAVAFMEGMVIVFRGGLEVADIFPSQFNRQVAQASILAPINKSAELFPVATDIRRRFAFGVASDKIMLG